MWVWLIPVAWLALVALWIFSIIEIVRSDPRDWKGIFPGRRGWLWTVILFGWLTSIGYMLSVRSQVRSEAAKHPREAPPPPGPGLFPFC